MTAMFNAVAEKFAGNDAITERARVGAAQMRKKAEGEHQCCPEYQPAAVEKNLRKMHELIADEIAVRALDRPRSRSHPALGSPQAAGAGCETAAPGRLPHD
jgi:hypothetical protein